MPRQESLMSPTHEVFNQAPALTGYDVADDPALLDALRREGAGWATDGDANWLTKSGSNMYSD